MKNRAFTIVSVIAMLILQFQIHGFTMGGAENKPGAEIEAEKDETVYISLDRDGSVKEINVVNRIQTPKEGTYIDYGTYEDISGLSKTAKYQVDGDKITWKLEGDSKDFYYQGKIKGKGLPFSFKMKYSIDGKEIPPGEMTGKKGRAKIMIDAIPDLGVEAKLREKYFYQIQTGLDLDRCKNIKAPGATSIMSGRTQNLGFMLMPDKRDSFEISFDTDDFAFEGLTITSIELDVKNILDFDPREMKDGFEKLTHASESLIKGTDELKLGIEGLATGMKKFSCGADETKLGLDKFGRGLTEFSGGVSVLTKTSGRINEELKKLAQGGESLSQGFGQIKVGIESGFSKLGSIVPTLLSPELAHMAAELREGTGGFAEYEESLNKFTTGVSALSAGMEKFHMGLLLLESSGGELLPGLNLIIDGMGALADGLSEAAGKVKSLPKEVVKLIDGQTQIRDGLRETARNVENFCTDEVSEDTLLSFVSEKNNPKSLQFIYRTAEISPAIRQKPEITFTEEKKGFLKRLFDLFKKS